MTDRDLGVHLLPDVIVRVRFRLRTRTNLQQNPFCVAFSRTSPSFLSDFRGGQNRPCCAIGLKALMLLSSIEVHSQSMNYLLTWSIGMTAVVIGLK